MMQNTPTLNQLPSPLEHTLDGHAGQGTTDSRPAPAPHILALSSFAEDSTSVFPKMDGGIGETPIPPIRALVSQKRSRRSSFFAFSSNRKSRHGTPIIHMPQSQQSTRLKAHLADPSDIPSPLRTDNEDYYYCQYSPSQTSSPAIPRLDTSSLFPLRKRRSVRSQSHHVTLDSDSQQSSPINQSSPSHLHPHVYSSSLSARAQSSAVPQDACPAQGSSSRDGQERPRGEKSEIDEPDILLFPIPPQQPPATPRKNSPSVGIRPPQPRGLLRSSFSVPNLSSAVRVADGQTSATKTPASGKRRDVLLTAGNWCDTLIFPRPRLKVQHGPISSRRPVISPPSTPIPGDDPGAAVTAFPPRPATASATLMAGSVTPNTQSPATLAEAAMLNSAVDTVPEEQQPAPVADHADRPDDRPPPSPPPSVAQVLKESEDLERLRERWRAQATKSLGNKHARSFSRARSKSLSEKHVFNGDKPDTAKSGSNFEYLAARALLGSQSVQPRVLTKKSSNSLSHFHSKSYSQATHSTPILFHSSQSHSRSHAHSHSLSTSNSSKSSRNPFQHQMHSRSESWGSTAIKKAGALCGAHQNESQDAHVLPIQVPDEEVVNTSDPLGNSGDGGERERFPLSGEAIGIAISLPSPYEHVSPGHDFSMPSHPFALGSPPCLQCQSSPDTQDAAHHHTRTLSDYAGKHPSVLDPNLPPPTATSDVSMRHRLPPRPAPHLTVPSISHPFGVASPSATPSVGEQGQLLQRLRAQTISPRISTLADCALGPHTSVSSTEFERYGVGKALVCSVLPRQADAMSRNTT